MQYRFVIVVGAVPGAIFLKFISSGLHVRDMGTNANALAFKYISNIFEKYFSLKILNKKVSVFVKNSKIFQIHFK